MSTPILHHYEFSTFSEKIRTALGAKQLTWKSVDIPGMPPRPLLTPLTGGYRRAPVLQIGADIYCDTHAILSALERFKPNPSLFPAGQEGLARGLGFAWERQMWVPTIGVLVHFIGEHIPPEFIKDRKEGYLGIDISKAAMAPQFEEHVQFVRAQIAWLAQCVTAHKYVLGDQLSAADLACWQTIFLLRKNCPPEVDALLNLGPILPWYERIAAIGHGTHSVMSAEEAFEVAKAAKPMPITHIAAGGNPEGISVGSKVSVTPEDNARVPVVGTLLACDAFNMVIHRHDDVAGDLNVHFPRLGYTLAKA
ncbi:MAG: glutathione S-transferase family protein [Betaproteobacteria bacterium]|jgi:glutathione S-transferase|nr:glutathione S-transferase family protein [Betaproteobacteria bacterium]